MVIAALFEIVCWVAFVGAALQSRAWLFACLILPIALFRVAVSVAALGAKAGDKSRDNRP